MMQLDLGISRNWWLKKDEYKSFKKNEEVNERF